MQQYTLLVDGHGGTPYRKSHAIVVKSLAISQLVLGFLIFFLHVFTTILNVNFAAALEHVQLQLGDPNFFTRRGAFDDIAGTGIWVGVLIIATAGVGISACTERKKKLVYAHLILNSLVLVAIIFAITTLAVTVDTVCDCRTIGAIYRRQKNAMPTKSPLPIYFYGEELKNWSGIFYCKHTMFSVWLTLDSIMLGALVIEIALATTLVVFNSIAVGCCRSCCCRCCRCGQEEQAFVNQQRQEISHGIGQHQEASLQAPSMHAYSHVPYTAAQPGHPPPTSPTQLPPPCGPEAPPTYSASETLTHPVSPVSLLAEGIETFPDPSAPQENAEGAMPGKP